MRFKLGLSDDEDEEDSGETLQSEQDLCHPLCQCDKCSKWQKVCCLFPVHFIISQNFQIPRFVLHVSYVFRLIGIIVRGNRFSMIALELVLLYI